MVKYSYSKFLKITMISLKNKLQSEYDSFVTIMFLFISLV